MEAFQGGLGAAQNYQTRENQNATLYGQVMSTMLQIQSQQAMEKLRGEQALTAHMATLNQALQVEGLKQTGDLARTQLHEQSETGRTAMHEQAESDRTAATNYSNMQRDVFSKNMERGTTLMNTQLTGQNQMQVEALRAHNAAMQDMVNSEATNRNALMTSGQWDPAAAAFIARRQSDFQKGDQSALADLQKFGASPKAQREGAVDAATINEKNSNIQRNNVENWKTGQEYGPDGYKDKELYLSSQKVAAENGMMIPHLQTALTQQLQQYIDMNPAVKDKAAAYGAWQQIGELSQQAAQHPENAGQYQAQLAQIVADPKIGISTPLWEQMMMTRDALTKAHGMYTGALGNSVQYMPTTEQIQAVRNMNPQAQGFIQRAVNSISQMSYGQALTAMMPNFVKEGVGLASQTLGLSGSAPQESDYSGAFAEGYKQQTGKLPDGKMMQEFNNSSTAARLGILRQYAEKMGPNSQAAQTVKQFDNTNYSLATIGLGDIARNGTGGGSWWGAGGDAIGFGIAAGVGKFVVAPVLSKIGGSKMFQAAGQKVASWIPGYDATNGAAKEMFTKMAGEVAAPAEGAATQAPVVARNYMGEVTGAAPGEAAYPTTAPTSPTDNAWYNWLQGKAPTPPGGSPMTPGVPQQYIPAMRQMLQQGQAPVPGFAVPNGMAQQMRNGLQRAMPPQLGPISPGAPGFTPAPSAPFAPPPVLNMPNGVPVGYPGGTP